MLDKLKPGQDGNFPKVRNFREVKIRERIIEAFKPLSSFIRIKADVGWVTRSVTQRSLP